MIWFWLALLALVMSFLYVVYRCKKGNQLLLKVYKNGNVINCGTKGKGKDMQFQHVINLRGEKCYANIDYGPLCTVLPLSVLNCGVGPNANTFEKVLEGNITIIPKEMDEGCDYYISDAGVHLPSQHNNLIDKKYPTLAIRYALSRHLTNSNIHANSQYLGRIYNKLREQADGYMLARGTLPLPYGILCSFRYYQMYESCDRQLSPISLAMIPNKYRRAEKDVFNASNGIIKNGLFFIRYKDIHYDSRIFHKLMYGTVAPKTLSKFAKFYIL